jgi:transcriptional regulator with XRE-family HTH domain
MAAKKRTRLQGLTPLGAKLRELRLNAGISQMKLAEMLGLNPAHGYKYILRLEKGLVPNPTLRTITGYLKACNAGWQDIADVLTQIDLTETGHTEPEKKPEPVIIAPYLPETAPGTKQFAAVPPAINQTRLSKENFWQLVQKALDRTWSELRTLNLAPNTRRALLTFVRSLCLTITRYPPRNLESELQRLLDLFILQGLDKNLLTRVQQICIEICSGAAGK